MAYQTGVASSLPDLISTVFNFAKANGFADAGSWSYTQSGNTYNLRSLSKGGVFFNFSVLASGNAFLYLNTASGQTSGATDNAQLGACPWSTRVDNLAGPYVGYHLFCDGSVVNVVVEIVTGVFVHFNFGTIQKNGDFVGGDFVTGLAISSRNSTSLMNIWDSYHFLPFDGNNDVGSPASYGSSMSSHVRTPISGPVAGIGRNDSTPTEAYCTCWASNAGRPLLLNSPNKVNGRAVLVPINFVQASSGKSTGPFYQLGTVANARAINIANLNPKQMVNTDWMVFPVSQKNGPGTTYLNSGNMGLAYRK